MAASWLSALLDGSQSLVTSTQLSLCKIYSQIPFFVSGNQKTPCVTRDDLVSGGNGDDFIGGDGGDDTINGGNGEDFLIGGDGADNVNGGDGEDICFPNNFAGGGGRQNCEG